MDRDPPPLGNLAHAGPGEYRLRVTARGRDQAAASLPEPEQFQVTVWPAPLSPTVVHFANDATSRYFGYLPTDGFSDPILRDQVRGCYEYVRGVLLDGTFDRSWGPCGHELQLDPLAPNPLGVAKAKMVDWLGVEGTVTPENDFCVYLEPVRDLAIVGTFQETMSNQVRFTWDWAQQPRGLTAPPTLHLRSPTTVELTLRPNPDGVQLSVTQDNLPFELVSPFSVVWSYYLDRLRLLSQMRASLPAHPWLDAATG
jgi:hypothetical protein